MSGCQWASTPVAKCGGPRKTAYQVSINEEVGVCQDKIPRDSNGEGLHSDCDAGFSLFGVSRILGLLRHP